MRSFRQSRLIWCSIFLLGIGVVMLAGGCGGSDDDDDQPDPMVSRADVVKYNAMIAFSGYSDALSTAMDLQDAVNTFVDTPGMMTFGAAKDAWLRAREAYQPTEVYRFRLGPIDTLNDMGEIGDDGDGPEARINGWPLGEAFIDYVAEGMTDGDDGPSRVGSTGLITPNIIADTTNVDMITKDVLKGYVEHGDDERNLATGYHAIEFLLWGQDLNRMETMWSAAARDNSAGQRPVSDYVQNDQQLDGTCTSGPTEHDDHEICQRRAMYLKEVTALLVDDLQLLVDAWNPDGNDNDVVNYYEWFTDEQRTTLALSKIVEGMGRMAFGELAGERITIALLTGDQEEEHSCFSDNTHRDIFLNVVGLQNMYLGDYNLEDDALMEYMFDTDPVSGPGIYDLLKEADSALAERLKTAIMDAVEKAKVISDLAESEMPFDLQIEDRNDPEILALLSALNAVIDPLETAKDVLDIETGDLLQDTCETVDGRVGTGEDCPQASS